MKKILKSRIFVFLLGFILAGSISVMATARLQANEIGYKNTTVDKVLDELYNVNHGIQYVGGANGNFNAYNTYVNVQGENANVNEKQATISNDGIFTLKKNGKIRVCSVAKGHACNECTNSRLYHNSTIVYSQTNMNEIYRCDEIEVLENDTIKYQVSNSSVNGWIIGAFWIVYTDE